jgi:hypothetical protein
MNKINLMLARVLTNTDPTVGGQREQAGQWVCEYAGCFLSQEEGDKRTM